MYVCILCVIHAYMWMRRILLVRACFGCVCNVCMRSICTKCMHVHGWSCWGLDVFVSVYAFICLCVVHMPIWERTREMYCVYTCMYPDQTRRKLPVAEFSSMNVMQYEYLTYLFSLPLPLYIYAYIYICIYIYKYTNICIHTYIHTKSDTDKREALTRQGRRYAEQYHSSATEHRILGQALALLHTNL